jgi:hypothetical protein
VNIIARIKTIQGNHWITQKAYRLSIVN